jgi:hypothetical protein
MTRYRVGSHAIFLNHYLIGALTCKADTWGKKLLIVPRVEYLSRMIAHVPMNFMLV